VPDWPVATIMETYYRGRTECKIRRLALAGLYFDFLAQYPTVFVLLGLWPFLIARGISWQHGDPEEVQALLEQVTADDVLKPDLWRGLHVLCLVEPDGGRLPTRARYNGRTYNVALADRTDRLEQWYTLADCIASKLETCKAPRVVRVLCFAPLGPQPGLRTITLPGGLDVDPCRDDLIRASVEQRAWVKRQRDEAEASGDSELEHRFDAEQLGMKIAANATAYGIPIELNLTEHKRPVSVTVYRPDGGSYHTRSRRIEEPGTWFHPLLATLVPPAAGSYSQRRSHTSAKPAPAMPSATPTASSSPPPAQAKATAVCRRSRGRTPLPSPTSSSPLTRTTLASPVGRSSSSNPRTATRPPASFARFVVCRSPPNATPSTPPARAGGRRSSATHANANGQNTASATSHPREALRRRSFTTDVGTPPLPRARRP
jgi:hypothetical protein